MLSTSAKEVTVQDADPAGIIFCPAARASRSLLSKSAAILPSLILANVRCGLNALSRAPKPSLVNASSGRQQA